MALTRIVRGDDTPIRFTWDDEDTVFVAGDVMTFTMKRHPDDDTPIVSLSSVDGDITFDGRHANAEIPASATEGLPAPIELHYDWQLVTASSKTHTGEVGTVVVIPDITRATAP